MSETSPIFFATPSAFRDWLSRHAATTPELIVGYYKVDSGQASMTWSESVDEALCDGVRKRIDERSYLIRFTPRKPETRATRLARLVEACFEGRRLL